MLSGVLHAALRLFDARSYLRAESGVSGRGPSYEDQPISRSLMQRGGEQRRKCGWHLFFALILAN